MAGRRRNSSAVTIAVILLLLAAVLVTRTCNRSHPANINADIGTAPAAISATPPATGSASPNSSSQPFDASQLDPRVTQATIGTTIGISGYTARVRPRESVTGRIKRELMRQHGYIDSPADYELDHFIPLGVGGSSNLSNLWLEPIGEAKRKDADELLAHEYVTSGRWTLEQGQQYIRARWRIHYAQ